MKYTTLVILMDSKGYRLLMGFKKRGNGKNKYNFFGGKCLPNESPEECAIRELKEESNIDAQNGALEKVGEILFVPTLKSEEEEFTYLFLVKEWHGTPLETDEMSPHWFNLHDIPYKNMWDSDQYWLPPVLLGKKIKATFVFNEDNESVKSKELVFL